MLFKIHKFKLSLLVAVSLFMSLFLNLEAKSIEAFKEVNINGIEKLIFKEFDESRLIVIDVFNDILIDRITNDKNVIRGRAFKNSILKFLVNDIEYIANTDEDGNFILLLEEGVLVDIDQINVKIYDYLNNELSSFSFVIHDILPPVDPKIEYVVNNSDNVIRGIGEPNSLIKVFIGDKEFNSYTSVIGDFEIEVGDSLRDVQSFKMISHDSYNNQSNLVEKQVNDVIAPQKPNINLVDCLNNLVQGSGEANCEVVASFDDKKYRTYIDDSGSFFIYDDEGDLDSTDLITMKVIDKSGNISEEILYKIQKENVGKLVLKSLDVNNKIIRDAMIKVNNLDYNELVNEDKVFNLNSDGNLFLDDIPFGDYELVIRYRTNENKLEENILNISINKENSEVEVLID